MWGAFWSVRDPEYNVVGLNRRETWVVATSVVAIAFVWQSVLLQPGGVAKLFDVAAVRKITGIGSVAAQCTVGRFWDPSEEKSEWCEKQGANAGRLFDHIPTLDGKPREYLTSTEEEVRRAQEQLERGCFNGRWDGFSQSSSDYGVELGSYLRFGTAGPARLTASPGPELDKQLVDYGQTRLVLIENSLHFFGEGGLSGFNHAVDNVDNQVPLKLLSQRLKDPAFAATLEPMDRIELELLVSKPLSIKPCWANQPHGAARASP
jgi:hypothetical protein